MPRAAACAMPTVRRRAASPRRDRLDRCSRLQRSKNPGGRRSKRIRPNATRRHQAGGYWRTEILVFELRPISLSPARLPEERESSGVLGRAKKEFAEGEIAKKKPRRFDRLARNRASQ